MRFKLRKRAWLILCLIGVVVVVIHNLRSSEPVSQPSLSLPAELPNNTVPDAEATAGVDLIMRHTGLPANFELVAADSVENAVALMRIKHGALKRVILYNRSFMDSVLLQTESTLAKTFVLAHEIGHHLCGHTLRADTLMSHHAMELEADKFAGFIFFRLGATLEQAEIVIEKMAGDVASVTHPAKEDRLLAIRQGWLEAQALTGEEIVARPSTSTETTGTRVRPVESTQATTQPVTAPAAKFHTINVGQSTSEIRIQGTVDLLDLKERDCIVTAWFFDDSGRPLRDLNQRYRTRSGGVATSVVVRPASQQARQIAITLTIPKNELHLGTGKHRVVMYLGLSVANMDFSVSSMGHMFFIEN